MDGLVSLGPPTSYGVDGALIGHLGASLGETQRAQKERSRQQLGRASFLRLSQASLWPETCKAESPERGGVKFVTEEH
jgi:hypothetical protein